MVYPRETYVTLRMWGDGRRPIRKSGDGHSHSHASGSGDAMPRVGPKMPPQLDSNLSRRRGDVQGTFWEAQRVSA